MLERELQSFCNATLRRLGILFFHAEQGRGYTARHQHRAGWPDMMIFPGIGKTFFVELKSARGRLSKDQDLMRSALTALGYQVHEVRAKEDFLSVLKAHKILKD